MIMFELMPQWFPLHYWQYAFNSPLGEISLAAHAKAAPDELKQLAEEIKRIARKTSIPTPSMDRLFGAIDNNW
jgi:hypothetical protein